MRKRFHCFTNGFSDPDSMDNKGFSQFSIIFMQKNVIKIACMEAEIHVIMISDSNLTSGRHQNDVITSKVSVTV